MKKYKNALVYRYSSSFLQFVLQFVLNITYCILVTRDFCSSDLETFISNIFFACLSIFVWYICSANLGFSRCLYILEIVVFVEQIAVVEPMWGYQLHCSSYLPQVN